MPFFSKIKGAKKAAEEHKKAAEAQAAEKPPPPPYKHVPTHAAQDARAGAPSSWTPQERSVLVAAAHKKRRELKMISLSQRASTGDFHYEIHRNKINQIRMMNGQNSRSSSFLDLPGTGSSRASLNIPRSRSSNSLHSGIHDIGPPGAPFSVYDPNFAAIMARKHESLQRSSLNKTLADAPPVPPVPAKHLSPSGNLYGSSVPSSSHSGRSSFQQRPSPLSSSTDPSPVESSNSSFSSNHSSSSSALEMPVPNHSYPHPSQKPLGVPPIISVPRAPISDRPYFTHPPKPIVTTAVVTNGSVASVSSDGTATPTKKSWFRRRKQSVA